MLTLRRVVITNIAAQPGRTLILAGAGTPALTLAARLSRLLADLGLGQELLGGVVADWNTETRSLRGWVGGSTLMPATVLPGLPHGFGADTDLCLDFRGQWRPWLEEAFRQVHRRSTEAGLVGGLVVEPLTTGGHLPVCYAIDQLVREHFGQAFRLGVFWLPSDMPRTRIWENLRRWQGFPDDLGMPVLVADNAFRATVDRAVPLALAGILAGRHLADPTSWSLVEVAHHLTADSAVLGLAYAQIQIPLIRRRVLGLPLGPWQVATAELALRLADVLAQVLDPAAALLSLAEGELGREAFSLVVLTGFPGLRGVERERLEQEVRARAARILEERGRAPLPAGLRLIGLPVFWATATFALLEAVWVFPARVRVRELVERMLAGKAGSLRRWVID